MNTGTLLAQIEQLNKRIEDLRAQAQAAGDAARTVETFSSVLAELPELTARLEDALAKARPTEWMSTAEVAEYIGVSAKLASQMAMAGDLPGYKVGERYRFDRSEVDQAIKDINL